MFHKRNSACFILKQKTFQLCFISESVSTLVVPFRPCLSACCGHFRKMAPELRYYGINSVWNFFVVSIEGEDT